MRRSGVTRLVVGKSQARCCGCCRIRNEVGVVVVVVTNACVTGKLPVRQTTVTTATTTGSRSRSKQHRLFIVVGFLLLACRHVFSLKGAWYGDTTNVAVADADTTVAMAMEGVMRKNIYVCGNKDGNVK